jgi:hypothetical protein
MAARAGPAAAGGPIHALDREMAVNAEIIATLGSGMTRRGSTTPNGFNALRSAPRALASRRPQLARVCRRNPVGSSSGRLCRLRPRAAWRNHACVAGRIADIGAFSRHASAPTIPSSATRSRMTSSLRTDTIPATADDRWRCGREAGNPAPVGSQTPARVRSSPRSMGHRRRSMEAGAG